MHVQIPLFLGVCLDIVQFFQIVLPPGHPFLYQKNKENTWLTLDRRDTAFEQVSLSPCIVYSSQLAHHLPLSCPQNVSLHSNGGSHVLQLLHAARRHLLPGTSPSRGWRCHLLQHPACRGGRVKLHWSDCHCPTPSRDHATSPTNHGGDEQWGDLHHHHHKVCSPADHLEHVCSWIGLLYNVGHTEGLCYLSIYYLSPHVTGLIMRHLEQWDLTNWENSLTVSIPHPSPEPQHLFFVSPSQVDSIGHSQYGVQLFAKNSDFVKLMQVGNGNLAVSPANHWLTELAQQGLNPQPLSGVVWRGLWVSQLTRHFVRGTGTCWKYAQETWQNTWVFL